MTSLTSKAMAIGAVALSMLGPAQAGIFFIPIPNVSKPRQLEALIEALEKSDETKAVAYVSEDKTFGSKYWVWGHYSGHVLQDEANRIALEKCGAALANVKSQLAGGQPVYDFGSKKCELHEFTNSSVSAIALARARDGSKAEPPPPTPPNPNPSSVPLGSIGPTPPVASSSVSGSWCLLSPEGTTLCTFSSWTSCNDAKPNGEFRCLAASPSVGVPAAQPAPEALKVVPPATSTTQVTMPPNSSASSTNPPQTSDSPAARRLRELQQLRKEGLISQEEYEQKRKAVLSTL